MFACSSCSWCQRRVVLSLHPLGARRVLLLLFVLLVAEEGTFVLHALGAREELIFLLMLLVPEEGCVCSSCFWCQRRVAFALHTFGARGGLLLLFMLLVPEEGCSVLHAFLTMVLVPEEGCSSSHVLDARGGLLLLFMLLVPGKGCSPSSCSLCQRRPECCDFQLWHSLEIFYFFLVITLN